MQVIPAIDLMKGKVVRLTQGDPEKATFYDSMGTPLEIAKKWQDEGAKRLHIIDLDAAFGKPDNLEVITEIAKTTELPIQVGGGIRSVEIAERLLNAGIQYVILGSLAFSDPYAIVQLQKEFSPERVIVALDHREGVIMVEGWTSSTSVSLRDALAEYASLGAKSFLITSITKDGTLKGPDLGVLEEACQYSHGGVIAAGGIGTLEDLQCIKKVGAEAAVVGKALYEEKFTLKEAIAAVQGE